MGQEKTGASDVVDISSIYCKRIDLYNHIDTIIWTSFVAMLGVVYGCITLIMKFVFPVVCYFPTFLIALFMSLVLKSYHGSLEKFNKGRSALERILNGIESSHCGKVFTVEISSESVTYKTFFERRLKLNKLKASVQNNPKDTEDSLFLQLFYKLGGAVGKRRIRSMQDIVRFAYIMFALLSFLSFAACLLQKTTLVESATAYIEKCGGVSAVRNIPSDCSRQGPHVDE